MQAADFARLGQRCFGSGWQETFAGYAGYNRTSISHFGTGREPVPPHLALLLQMLADRLDEGKAPLLIKPVGRILDGDFAPL
jgi:hypothetical protein